MNFKVLIVTYFLSCALAQEVNVTTEESVREAGGVVAVTIPYQASLRNVNGTHYCGGAIISDTWILTSAYCLEKDYPNFTRIGSNYLDRYNNYKSGESFYTRSIFKHDNYNSTTLANDIGLVQTQQAMVFNANIKPINLPIAHIPEKYNLIATGWRFKTYDNKQEPVDNLQILTTISVKQHFCYHFWLNFDKILYPSMMCTYTRFGQGFCEGFLGGPLVDDGFVHGIIGYTDACGPGYPDVVTRVFSVKPWILDIQARNI